MKIFHPNQTSASLFVRYAEEKYVNSEEEKNIEKYLIIYDVFIKARSYYMINKIFFFLALFSGVVVLLWPSLSILAKELGWEEKGLLSSAIVQTTVTGIAALAFSVYSHYKKRQMYAENIMRFAVFSEDTVINIKDYVAREMERIDSGFSFEKSISQDANAQKNKDK